MAQLLFKVRTIFGWNKDFRELSSRRQKNQSLIRRDSHRGPPGRRARALPLDHGDPSDYFFLLFRCRLQTGWLGDQTVFIDSKTGLVSCLQKNTYDIEVDKKSTDKFNVNKKLSHKRDGGCWQVLRTACHSLILHRVKLSPFILSASQAYVMINRQSLFLFKLSCVSTYQSRNSWINNFLPTYALNFEQKNKNIFRQ